MKQSKEKFVPLSMALLALLEQCDEASTGAMFLITDKGHGAIVSIMEGRIVEVSYHSLRGTEALPLVREINRTKFFFKHNSNPGKNSHPQNNISLLNNDAIFKSLFKVIYTAHPSTLKVNGKDKKVLVVEDSALARKALVQVLKGYETVEAADGFEALGKLSEENPDLVLLDLILPKMDGYAVLSAMKKDPKYKNIPVIVLTSRDALFDKLKGKMSGTNEYLTKPIKPEEVINKVKKYLD